MNDEFKELKNLITEVELYQEANRILRNYDVDYDMHIWTHHNDNSSKGASVSIPLEMSKKEVEDLVSTRLTEAVKALETSIMCISEKVPS